MKKLFIILSLVVLSSVGCSNTRFIVCGLDITNMNSKDFGVTALGAAASMATHIAGHYLAAEIMDVDFELQGLEEIVDYSQDYSQNQLQWFARGGFVLQVGVNLALTTFAEDSYFTKGYTAFTAAELLSYPFRRQGTGDFVVLDEQGADANLEYALYLGLTGYNFMKVSLKEE